MSHGGEEEDCSLGEHVLKHIESNQFEEIIDPIIVGNGVSEEKAEQLRSFEDPAIKCTLVESPEDRPTMIEVAKELTLIYLVTQHNFNLSNYLFVDFTYQETKMKSRLKKDTVQIIQTNQFPELQQNKLCNIFIN